MKLYEYQASEILSRYGVPVPKSYLAHNAMEAMHFAEVLGHKVVVKAQVLMGGRGKAGGVKLFDHAKKAAEFTKELIGKKLVSIQNPKGMIVEKVLITEQIQIQEQYYLSVLLDRAKQKLVVMLSSHGGVEIEDTAAKNPQAIIKLYVDPAWGLSAFGIRRAVQEAGIPKAVQAHFIAFIPKLIKAYEEMDAELIEINPLALTTDGKLIAADAKISIDDNALFRHIELQGVVSESAEDPLEAEAMKRGIAYVRLSGDIGLIGNGAGLVMCSMDEIKKAGGSAANFLDVGGGAQEDRVKSCVELVLMDPNIKGLLINIFGGITRCDEVAKGVLAAFKTLDVKIPVVARIEGTAAEQGRTLLKGSLIVPVSSMQEAAKKIVELAYASEPLSSVSNG